MLYIIRKIVQVTNCEIMHGQDPPFKEIKGGGCILERKGRKRDGVRVLVRFGVY